MSATPTIVKNWQYGTIANALTSSDLGNQVDLILQRTANRISLGHLVAGSGNGTSGAMDGVNRWASVSDFPASNNGVWQVIEQPGTSAQDLMHYFNGGQNIWTWYHSPSGGFTGGSSSARPTAPDESVLYDNTFFGRGDAGSDPQFVLNWWCSSDLTCYRESYWCGNFAIGDVDFSAIDDPPDGWATPNYGMVDKDGFWVTSGFGGSLRIGRWDNYTYIPSTGHGLFKSWGAHGQLNMMTTVEASGYGSLQALPTTALTAKETSSNKYRPPFQPGLYEIFTNADGGWKGRIFDMWWVADSQDSGAVFASGSTAPLTGPVEFVIIGDKMLPWSGTFRTT